MRQVLAVVTITLLSTVPGRPPGAAGAEATTASAPSNASSTDSVPTPGANRIERVATGLLPGRKPPRAAPKDATPTLQYATGFEPPVSLPPTDEKGNSNQYLKGGDIAPFTTPLDLWGTPAIYRAWALSIVGPKTPVPASTFVENTIRTVTGRNGQPTRALSLHSRSKSPHTDLQAAKFQNAKMESEPVFYQRAWIKFDPDTLARGKREGERTFWQMFWEADASPDYRIRLQLQYDEKAGLYWQVQGDVLSNAIPIWSATLKTVPVVLVPADEATGWHKIEIWMDRPAGRFKAAIDGQLLIDHTGNLMGESRNRIDHLILAMVSGELSLGQILVDDLEIWSAPPPDAWKP